MRREEVQGVEREIKIPEFKNKANCIVGPRKSGKTWLFLMHSRNDLYVDFSDIAFSKLRPEEFFRIIEIFVKIKGRKINRIFLDEIQELNGWETLVLSLLHRGYRVYATGSSSKILRKEFSSALRGKAVVKLLLPFSFREFLKARKHKIETRTFEGRGEILKHLEDFITLGGYPEVVLNAEKKEELWRSYFDEIFYKDFVERHRVRNTALGKFLMEFIFQNFSKEMSINKIKTFMKGKVQLSDKTLYQYAEKLEDTLNIFFVERFSKSVYKRKSWPVKAYICDVGISNILAYSHDKGKRIENLVFLELLRKTNENPLMEIFYWKDYQGREVDFVLKEGLKVKQLIQVTYASARDEIERREIKALLKASSLLKCRNLLCITWDYEDEEKIKRRRIKFLPLWKWLLKIR